MLTVNADDHELMRNYHKPEDEKRMVVIRLNGLDRDRLEGRRQTEPISCGNIPLIISDRC